MGEDLSLRWPWGPSRDREQHSKLTSFFVCQGHHLAGPGETHPGPGFPGHAAPPQTRAQRCKQSWQTQPHGKRSVISGNDQPELKNRLS